MGYIDYSGIWNLACFYCCFDKGFTEYFRDWLNSCWTKQLQKLNFTLSNLLDVDYFVEHLEIFMLLFPLLNSVGQTLVIQQLFVLIKLPLLYSSSIVVESTIVIWMCYYLNEENGLSLLLMLEVKISLKRIEGYYFNYFAIVWNFIRFIRLKLLSCFLIHHSIYFLIELWIEFPRILLLHHLKVELSHPKYFSFSF